ncbi:diheme cytochrome c [Alkalimarinus sediminis]|uniref:Diheme cytochrome c n=1 Tax=Alkalimarinus sediminis TaxID=1632866 RepID=A0A9E8KRF3_9ALTE|nr:diheme cytochrome c [Alkalimarinus sediminis]UZW76295.1 diheme cytochrome c [Alkalimarinus sediminis]
MSKFLLSTTLITTTLLITALVFVNSERALSDENGEEWSLFGLSSLKYMGVAPVDSTTYKDECGSCHMAYSPGLLPVDSWKKVMLNLENHFGDNAELEQSTYQELLKYLTDNAANHSEYRRSQKIVRSLKSNETVDRITQTPYFIREHDEIPKRLVVDNPEVGSFSQCNLCHLNAKKGSFNEDEVSIPGVGYWKD